MVPENPQLSIRKHNQTDDDHIYKVPEHHNFRGNSGRSYQLGVKEEWTEILSAATQS